MEYQKGSRYSGLCTHTFNAFVWYYRDLHSPCRCNIVDDANGIMIVISENCGPPFRVTATRPTSAAAYLVWTLLLSTQLHNHYYSPPMSPRKRALTPLGDMYDHIVASLFTKNATTTVQEASHLKSENFSSLGPLIKQASGFKLDNGLETLELTNPNKTTGLWKIEDHPDTQGFAPMPCILCKRSSIICG